MTSTPPFAVGSRVRHRSGGPVMTVQAVSSNLAYCEWVEEDASRHGTFEITGLEPLPTVMQQAQQPQPKK